MSGRLLTYILLVALRCISIILPGYIHPDEHCQNGQITGQWILGLHPEFTRWEYAPDAPSRSIISPLFSTGITFFLLKKLSEVLSFTITSRMIFIASRLPFLLGSFVVDRCIWTCGSKRSIRWRALLLWASSWLSMVMFIRPFGNSFVSVIYAYLLIQVQSMLTSSKSFYRNAFKAGFWLCFAAFGHFTFVFYALPIVLVHIYFAALMNSVVSFILYGLTAALGALVSGVACFIIDNIYFGRISGLDIDWKNLVFTPPQLAYYNLDMSKLAEHGFHPRYLHCTVNMLLFLGPVYLIWLWNILFSSSTWRKMSILLVCIPLAFLSVNPHQEPRYLMPLVIPVFINVAHHLRTPMKLFLPLWVLFNSILLCLFGGLHQGGVVPVMNVLSRMLTANTTIYAYKTYMLPRYLLANREYSNVKMPELVGLSPAQVKSLLDNDKNSSKLIVATGARLKQLNLNQAKKIGSVFPHLDLDNIETFNLSDPIESLTLNIYELQ